MNQDLYYYDGTQRVADISKVRQNHIRLPLNGYNFELLKNEITQGTIWGEYLKSCIRTWNQSNTPLLQIPNATLGLIGEVAEYIENSTTDELGDVLYYRAILLWLVGDQTEIFLTDEIEKFDFTQFTLLIADYTKKAVYHNKMYDAKTVAKLDKAIKMLDNYLWNKLTLYHNLPTFDSVFAENVQKLSKRHTQGFNPNHDSNV